MIIGIIGMSRSGSTVLSMVLNGLPGVTSFGEAHHFIHKPDWAGCTSCGPDNCPVLTPEVRAEAERVGRQDPDKLYEHLRAVAGTEVFVVSDKLPKTYATITGPPERGLLVLKDPKAAIRSNISVLRKTRGQHDKEYRSPPTDEEVDYALRMLGGYHGIMNWCDRTGFPWRTVPVESLVDRPEEMLAHLAEFCGVEPDPQALRFWDNPQHQIAGNTDVRTQRGPLAGGIRKDERWREFLTEAQAEKVDQDEEIRRIYARAYDKELGRC